MNAPSPPAPPLSALPAPAEGPAGVDGWLALLVISLLVGGPMIGATKLYEAFVVAERAHPDLVFLPAWETYKTLSWVTFALVAAASFYGGIGLGRGRRWAVVRRARYVLWLTGPVTVLVMNVLLPAIAFGGFTFGSTVVGPFLFSCAIAGLWTAYLAKSKRVRNTYGPPD